MAREVYSSLKERVALLRRRGIRPGLAAIVIGDDPASEAYVRTKSRACAEVGLHSELHRFVADCAESEVIALIAKLNADAGIHGVLVQLPLPPAFAVQRILQAVHPAKDVDGFNWHNLGALAAGQPLLAPCTPLAVMTMLERENIAIEGSHAVVIGRSVIVGKPLALMLIEAGATVSICNSKTRDLRFYTSSADIVVVAAGKPALVNGAMLKNGAVVIDVGINRLADGRLVGDIDIASASEIASRITPVPGGVGRMTVAMLIANTLIAAERIAGAA